ncbi:hypothetical protein FXO37_15460 [Capsicum annuum]|nr:hypothetical protein FXO37_15460 [Capsicum annuum]
MEASTSASSEVITKIITRANDHPQTVDMTELVMSIKSSLSPPLSSNQGEYNLSCLPHSANEVQINNGESNASRHEKSKGTLDLCFGTPPPKQSSHIVGGTCSRGKNHIILHHPRGSANSVNHPRLCMAQIVKQGIDQIAEGLGQQL